MIIWWCYLAPYPHLPRTLFAPQEADWLCWSWQAEDGCCMWWRKHLRMLRCGLFLSCRLLWSLCSRLWLLTIVSQLILCKSLLFFAFHETWQRCMQSFIHQLKIDSVLFYTHVCVSVWLMCVFVCVSAAGHQCTCRHRGRACRLTSFKRTFV